MVQRMARAQKEWAEASKNRMLLVHTIKEEFKGDKKALQRVEESLRSEVVAAEFVKLTRQKLAEGVDGAGQVCTAFQLHENTAGDVQASEVLAAAPQMERELRSLLETHARETSDNLRILIQNTSAGASLNRGEHAAVLTQFTDMQQKIDTGFKKLQSGLISDVKQALGQAVHSFLSPGATTTGLYAPHFLRSPTEESDPRLLPPAFHSSVSVGLAACIGRAPLALFSPLGSSAALSRCPDYSNGLDKNAERGAMRSNDISVDSHINSRHLLRDPLLSFGSEPCFNSVEFPSGRASAFRLGAVRQDIDNIHPQWHMSAGNASTLYPQSELQFCDPYPASASRHRAQQQSFGSLPCFNSSDFPSGRTSASRLGAGREDIENIHPQRRMLAGNESMLYPQSELQFCDPYPASASGNHAQWHSRKQGHAPPTAQVKLCLGAHSHPNRETEERTDTLSSRCVNRSAYRLHHCYQSPRISYPPSTPLNDADHDLRNNDQSPLLAHEWPHRTPPTWFPRHGARFPSEGAQTVPGDSPAMGDDNLAQWQQDRHLGGTAWEETFDPGFQSTWDDCDALVKSLGLTRAFPERDGLEGTAEAAPTSTPTTLLDSNGSTSMHDTDISTHQLNSPIADMKAFALDTEFGAGGKLADFAALEMTAAGVLTGCELVSVINRPASAWLLYDNITDEENSEAPALSVFAPRLIALTRRRVVWAWNVPADKNVIEKELEILGLALEEVIWLDAMVLARRLGFASLSLTGAGLDLGMQPPKKMHRARADAQFMVPIIARMVEIAKTRHALLTIGDLDEYIRSGGTPAVGVVLLASANVGLHKESTVRRFHQNEGLIRRVEAAIIKARGRAYASDAEFLRLATAGMRGKKCLVGTPIGCGVLLDVQGGSTL
jgi:hypothetical protein